MANYVRRGRAAVLIAIALGVPGLPGIPGGGIAVAQDIILEGSRNEWRWSITPYLWGSDIETDIRLPGGQQIGGTTKFNDILDTLDIGGMVHFEGQRGTWGMFVDATYLALSDDTTQGPFSADSELDTGLYEFVATYTPGGASGAFTAFAGARIVDVSLEVTLSGPGPVGPIRLASDKSFTDVIVGGRYTHLFNDRWLFNVRADMGAGDTESSWNVLAGFGWRFGGDLDKAVLFGWRHMEVEVEESGRETDVTLDGPIAGVYFSF